MLSFKLEGSFKDKKIDIMSRAKQELSGSNSPVSVGWEQAVVYSESTERYIVVQTVALKFY